MQLTPFHIAVQVRDIDEARNFYGVKMGLCEGRSSESWIDFNMFGHQFVVHLNPQLGETGKIMNISNPVDGHGVPVPHYGVVMNFTIGRFSLKKLAHSSMILSLNRMCGLKESQVSKALCFFQIPLVMH